MAFAYLYFGNGTEHGNLLRTALTQLEKSRLQLFDSKNTLFSVRDVMLQMRDGDGSSAAHYAEVTARFAFTSDANSKAAFDEIASACGHLGTTSDTQSTILAALDQLFAKMRG